MDEFEAKYEKSGIVKKNYLGHLREKQRMLGLE